MNGLAADLTETHASSRPRSSVPVYSSGPEIGVAGKPHTELFVAHRHDEFDRIVGRCAGRQSEAEPMNPSVHWLLVFIPIAVILDHAGNVPPPVIFFSAALAIMPIAVVIVRSTEQIAMRTGDAVGGLLNATFGNAPEL